jgi:hypothetical protein
MLICSVIPVFIYSVMHFLIKPIDKNELIFLHYFFDF